MDWEPRRIAGHKYNGLKNQGATCYLNSVLQCLYMTEVFRREVENVTRDPTNSDEESIDLIEELQKLFKMLKEHYGTTEGITRCLHICDVYEQQDVVEYYQKILYMITPQMSKIFKGELKTSTKCLLEHKHEQKSPLFCIPLPINSDYREVFSVDMAIENFSKKVKLGEDNLVYCDHCGQKSEAVTWTKIETFPTILTLNLKRFYINYYEMKLAKDHSPVKISLQLEFENHTKYQLYAVINHMGEGNGGHYHAVIKSFEDNEWYCFDDRFVTKEHGFEESLQHSKQAYLLMYRKMDDPHPDKSTNFTTNVNHSKLIRSTGKKGRSTTLLPLKVNWTKIETFPTILTLNLKRFYINYYEMKLAKDHSPVKISLQLEFENHTKYQLYAVINHMGEGNGGHYHAVIKSFEDNEWYCFDDRFVTKSAEQDSIAWGQRGHCELSTCKHDTYSSPALSHEFYHDIKLWSRSRQYGNCVAFLLPSLMEEDTPSAMRSYTMNTLEAVFQGLGTSNISGLNVPIQCEKLDADKRRWNLQVTRIQERQGEDIRKNFPTILPIEWMHVLKD